MGNEVFSPADDTHLVALLMELLGMKQGALRDLAQAVQVANDALRPLADRKPVSGPAQRALVTIALVSLGQASAALGELDVVVRESGANITREEPWE